jgi:protein phosphatase methylesterase 1
LLALSIFLCLSLSSLPATMSDRLGSEGDLRNSLLKSRIAKLPHLPAIAPSQWSSGSSSTEEQQEELDDIGTLGMAPPPRSSAQRNAESRSIDALYSPLSATGCFQEALEVDITEEDNDFKRATFRVYYTPPKKRSSKSRQKQADKTSTPQTLETLSSPNTVESNDDDDDDASIPGTVFFFHHGAGYSGLSYALVAKHITELSNGEAGVLAFDCRGHGEDELT